MTTETIPRMTVAEIALMREIIAWRKAHEIDFVKRRVYGAPYWKDYRTGKEVWFESEEEQSMALVAGRDVWAVHISAESVTQAVDVLVTFGYLPARFSSAYRAGWHAAQQWYDDQARDDAEFRRLFHDPENVSFPAGVDA